MLQLTGLLMPLTVAIFVVRTGGALGMVMSLVATLGLNGTSTAASRCQLVTQAIDQALLIPNFTAIPSKGVCRTTMGTLNPVQYGFCRCKPAGQISAAMLQRSLLRLDPALVGLQTSQ